MLKNKLLNSSLLSVLSQMGHTQTLTLADCGLPIPSSVPSIDLAISAGQPSFLSLLEILLNEAYFEGAFLAEELKPNTRFITQIEKLLKAHNSQMAISYLPHSQFKEKNLLSEAVVRTGEQTPYANIILIAAAFPPQ